MSEGRINVLYYNGELKIFSIDIQGNFTFEMSFNLAHVNIKRFIYIKEKSSFMMIDTNGKIFSFFYPSLEELLELNKKEIYLGLSQFQDLNILVKDIFYIKDFVILLDSKDDFYYLHVDNLGLNNTKEDLLKNNKSDKNIKKSEPDTNEIIIGLESINIDSDKSIIKICSIKRNYSKILKISSSEANIMFVDDSHQIFYINSADLNKMNTTTFSPKVIHDFTSKNIQEVACGENFWLLLEREEMKSLEKWNEVDVQEWFRSMDLDEFMNIIKYEKITGKDIVNADETFFVNIMGMMDDNQIKKIKYEINSVKNITCKKTNLWGWGSNKQGQLGQVNFNHTYIKSPRKINIPDMKHKNDFIIKIYCGKTFSLLQTKFGELYVTGNYSAKDKASLTIQSNKEANNNSGTFYFERKKHKNVDKKKDSIDLSKLHRWVNITKEVCFDSLCEYEE